jgi:hypothetical protein
MSEFELPSSPFGQDLFDPMLDPFMMDPLMQDPMMLEPLPIPPPQSYIPPPDPMMMPFDPMLIPDLFPSDIKPPVQPSLYEMRKEWEGRNIYKVLVEEIMMYRQGVLASFPRKIESYTIGWRALFIDLQKIMEDEAISFRQMKLEQALSEIDAFNISIEPLQGERQLLLDGRMPYTLRIRELRTMISEIKGFIANTMEGRIVAAFLYTKYTDQNTARYLLLKYETELNVLLATLVKLNDQVDDKTSEIGLIIVNFYKDRPNERDIENTYRDLVMEYTTLHPEMAVRRLELEIREDAVIKDKEIAEIVASEKHDAILEKNEFIKMFKHRSDEYVNRSDMLGSYIRAYYQVVWRTVWLTYGKQLIMDQQDEYKKRGESIGNEGAALQKTSDWYKLTHMSEIEKIGLRLATEGKVLQTAVDYLEKKTTLFIEKAKQIKDELSIAQANFERIKKFYDERLDYVHSKEYTAKMLREFRAYKEFKDTHSEIKRYFWQNFYDNKKFQTYPTGISSQIPPMLDFMISPPEFYVAGKRFPIRWPDRVDLMMITGFEWVQEKYWKKYREAEGEFSKRMKFDIPAKTIQVETLLDLWLSPSEHRSFIEGNASAFGWEEKEVKPAFRIIHEKRMIIEEMRKRFKFIMNRLESHMLQSVNMTIPDLSILSLIDTVKLYDRGVKYLETMTPQMKAIHEETAKIKDKIITGMAAQEETIAYMEALRIIRKYAYWSYITKNTQITAQAAKQGIA